MHPITLVPLVISSMFFGFWQKDFNAAGFLFSLMLFVCYVAEYIRNGE